MPTDNALLPALDGQAPSEPPSEALTAESAFYSRYPWCLNTFPSIQEAIGFLRTELARLSEPASGWQQEEVRRNVFLLACLISDTVDDYLLGPCYDFSRATNVVGPSRVAIVPIALAVQSAARIREWTTRLLADWRDRWEDAVEAFAAPPSAGGVPAEATGRMLDLLDFAFPGKLLAARPHVPAAFRSQDLTPLDAYALGRKFIDANPDRAQPVLAVGLRTAGSYFAPLLRAFLRAEGFATVHAITLRPKVGVSVRERKWLEVSVERRAMAVLIDEPVYSASTIATGLHCLSRAGFRPRDVVALFPVHPERRDWNAGAANAHLSNIRTLTLEPEEWYKAALLEPDAVRNRLAEYLGVIPLDVKEADATTARPLALHEPGFHRRLKRLFEVTLADGSPPIRRLVLAKSCGWGWLSYHAYLAGSRLAPRVPGLLGLREGIVYLDWIPPDGTGKELGRGRLVESAAAYVAARTRELHLDSDPVPAMAREGSHRGISELAAVLSRAYHWKAAAALKRPRLEIELSRLAGDRPTLIDGKMQSWEWVRDGDRLVKTDFEHHGMGKHQLNLTDPAYDLAETILWWKLSPEEERDLVRGYISGSGDGDVVRRLFLYKLLAGTWAMARAADGLKDPARLPQHAWLCERYLAALEFLTIHTMRFCAGLTQPPVSPVWRSPVVVLDVDGVLDKQVFGFPSTTAASLEALSLLFGHGFPVALNTARPVGELKEYCRSYGLLGGVAEYGAYVWDAASGRERVLVSPVSLEQMECLKGELRKVPGVFVSTACRYSVRAFTFGRGVTVPLPEMQVRTLLAQHGLDRLVLHQTFTDSTVTAAETNKGRGLGELLSLAKCPRCETIAVGDTEPDLAMFQAATRSFAPGHISCPEAARRMGCEIARRGWQPGLREIVRQIVHPTGGSCSRCLPLRRPEGSGDALVAALLRLADCHPLGLFFRAMTDPKAIRAFRR